MASLPGPTPIHSIFTPMSSSMRAMYFLAFSGRSSHVLTCADHSCSTYGVLTCDHTLLWQAMYWNAYKKVEECKRMSH